MAVRRSPYTHLSIRVPWHDSGWAGSICADPVNNGSCLRLSRIAAERQDGYEQAHAGLAWADLPPDDLPPCHLERGGFMSSTPRRVRKSHPYAEWNLHYQKFEPAWIELPSYSADCVPFRWMLRANATEIADGLDLAYEPRLEEQVDNEAKLAEPAWVQHEHNQRVLLDAFFGPVEPGASLAFFYAKETPMSDDPRRTLVGVGRVTSKTRSAPYGNSQGGFGSVTWETPIVHSIRPSMVDGFLLPYRQLLKLRDEQGLNLDLRDFAVQVPDALTDQFSYATEHVSHDAALTLLLALVDKVEQYAPLVDGDWGAVRSWLSERVAEVWDARGAFPGLGPALTAFGMAQGVLLARALDAATPEGTSPWEVFDRAVRDPGTHPELAPKPSEMLRKTWIAMPESRRALLELISRFDLSIAQAIRMFVQPERAKAGIDVSDAALLANPYLFFEQDRHQDDPISVGSIDRGVFPVERIRAAFPVIGDSRVDDPLDERRVRALALDQLERQAEAGHALMSEERLVQAIRDAPLDPPCPLTPDILAVASAGFLPEICPASMADGARAYQLCRLTAAKEKISTVVRKRHAARQLDVQGDWGAIIESLLGNAAEEDPDESLAREEKTAALQVLAQSRFSVLIGPAGTGKTTLLRALHRVPGVKERGVLLVAPTGKARVRMQAAIGEKASTLAQFLVRSGRYEPGTGRYRRSEHQRAKGFATVIVDECSMLTEEQLDALLDGIEGYERLVLVGDPRQLPPIGVGRPFVDIVEYLRGESDIGGFPRVGRSYAELTVKRRQLLTGSSEAERADMVLADWFAGNEVPPGGDKVWDDLARERDLGSLSLRTWSTHNDLYDQLRTELAASLPEMSGQDDSLGFQASYGGAVSGEYVYFNTLGSQKVESWQVLSPIRGEAGGVNELNRQLQRTYRRAMLDLANEPDQWARKIPHPAGPSEIVYGDKVINVRNQRRNRYWPQTDDALEYVANGEIGLVVGPFRRRGSKVSLNQWEVAFATQPGLAYKYYKRDFGSDDGPPVLELAYAITVHKAQGSEFGITLVVVPSPCRLLSRELLYTALTRQQHRVVLFMQGDLAELRGLASPKFSETAARVTNLFSDPQPVEVDGRFMEAGLIHRTRKGIHVRSKSELIIADLLYSKGIEFQYERELVLGGSRRLPDFTIDDADTGETYYWEHLGMLAKESYRRRWQDKLDWYASHGIRPRGHGPGLDSVGTLIVTQDGLDGSISSAEIEALVDALFSS